MIQRQRGAALLVAMIIVALVATLASAMVWQQWRAVQVETVERARTQSAWILVGASDWARLILREDQRRTDYLGEPWSLPLEEARLSTFLAADKDNTNEDGPEAFLSGAIVDAQSRYNLRNLASITDPDQLVTESKLLETLLDSIGVNGGDLAPRLVVAMRAAFPVSGTTASGGTSGSTSGNTSGNSTPSVSAYLQPQTVDQLAWFGVDSDSIARMTPYFSILPVTGITTVNINTAPKEVLAAAAGIDPGTAQQWIQRRQGKPFEDVGASINAISPGLSGAQQDFITRHLDVKSSYFEVHGRLRLADRVLEETSLVVRNAGTGVVTTLLRRRQSLRDVTN